MTWPHSAAVTQVLLTRKAQQQKLLPLAYKELVLRGALEVTTRRRLLGSTTLLRPLPRSDLARELQALHTDLLRVVPQGGSAQKVIGTMARKSIVHQGWYRDVRRAAVNAQLLTMEERRVLGLPAGHTLTLTKLGATAEEDVRELLASAAEHLDEPVVLLLSRKGLFPEIDRALAALDSAFGDIDGSCGDGGDGGDGGGGD
jgi:hypothetical protein